ncbi:hypothetical protein JR316_0003644 [Psilocybe cubensis]|uniref:Uncharacterized protein n=2 Tax=Psilocybe cubensis TaxID=181762 RepID=A0A8H7Y0R6_PSICU|nr:hypothetical protein JR316_0003644 [Psilocybe cubensis]KAH9484164.1 hypothetical protein JR316_0003644 [Psilocybe cubensis]
MDNRANLHETLFSRNSTPPAQQPLPQYPSVRSAASSSTPSIIDTLFQNITAPAPADHQPTLPEPHAPEPYESPAINPGLLADETATRSSPNAGSVAERQNALLSLIGGPAATTRPPVSQQPQQGPSQAPQQVPTPPGSSQRSNASPSGNDTQKILEQMMSGSSSRSTTYSDTQRTNTQQAAPSPPYSQRDDYRNFNQYEHSNETSPRVQTLPQPVQPIQQQQPPPPPLPQPAQDPPSPRRSIFEFSSVFDHISTSVKKKPVPPQPSAISSGNEDSGSWTNVVDPKRQSVENLLENLTRGQPQQLPPQPPAYEAYLSGGDFSQVEQSSSPVRAPLPPIPAAAKPTGVPVRTSSPHPSPPKGQIDFHSQPQPANTISVQAPYSSGLSFTSSGNRRDKEGSPGPRGGQVPNQGQNQPQNQNSNYNARQKTGAKYKAPVSPSPPSQVVNIDVSQSLDDIQAGRDSVKWTPIALVKQDAVFLPGTTIGATHWVAYAMTRGRVRVISRSSGDRTLLQLSQIFSPTASVIDMAVFGNRLAGVTSDGGFVVWELPEVITDDVPGHLLLCVPPTTDPHDAIRAVKWHPKDPNTLAIAADDKIYVIDLTNTTALHGQPLPHNELQHIGHLFTVSSPVAAFDFDVEHYALAAISEDSTLATWNMQDGMAYSVNKIRGDDIPSSLTFVEGGIVVGRKSGTIFQLLSATTKTVLSTVNFINSSHQDDADMFGHVSYDSRIQTLWVANSRRDSLFAMKVRFENAYIGDEENLRGYIDQVVEFSGIKPTIHFVILTADADPHGDEAHAACIAAKVIPGELALVGFSVHSTGVDQILIRREWFEAALIDARSKLPGITFPQSHAPDKTQRQPLPSVPSSAIQAPPNIGTFAPARNHTPTSDDVENEFSEARLSDAKSKGGAKGKNVNWKEKEDAGKGQEKASKPTDAAIINDSSLGQALSKEIKKTEENLHSRIGKLISKEMDKQHQRFEETRLHEQAEDFARQEKILKLISTELTRNTTRVVEMAVKNEIQNSVLPSLETITRNEVKSALNDQINVGLIDAINRSLPVEMEKLLLRPNISNHFANVISTTLTPMIERNIKEVFSANFFQFHSQQTTAMHQDLLRELRSEISTIKTDLNKWHNEQLRGQENTIRDLEHTVRTMAEQMKFLSMSGPQALHHIQPPPQQVQGSSGGQPVGPQQPTMNTSHLRQPNIPPSNPPVAPYQQQHPPFQPAPPPQAQPQMHQTWYNSIAAPQPSHPAQLPQAPVSQSQQERTPPPKPDQWDESYLGVLHSQDPNKLRELLSRTNPDLVFPLNGTPLVSQAVILTLVHRLSTVVGEVAPNDETFKSSLWWLQRVASLLRPDDKLIADFIPRVVPTVQQSLNTTKQRLAILPGGLGTIEAARQLSDIQESLRRKIA